jgi:hypothetical protein
MPVGSRQNPVEAPARSLGWPQVLAWRMRRHGLVERVPHERAFGVIDVICGLHAQLASSAELSLWARADGIARGDVDDALWKKRTLVKTWAMRGTLHVFRADDFPVWQAALSTYSHYLKGSWLRHFGVTRAELEAMIDAIGAALEGEPLTREQLADEVARRTGIPKLADKLRESWGAMLKPASFRGVLCFAPSSGKNVRFTRPDRRLRNWRPAGPGDALAEVTRRYLAAYGPASRDDYSRWWGHSPAVALRLIKSLGDDVVEVSVEGTRLWMLAADAAEAAEAAPTGVARLLPAFDPWVIGASRRSDAFVAPEWRDRVYRQQGWISPVLLVDGSMAGVWKHELKGSRLAVEIEPFGKLGTSVRRIVEAEADALARFFDAKLAVVGVER